MSDETAVPVPTEPHRATQARDLWRAVDALTEQQRIWPGARNKWDRIQTLPSLWAQLNQAIHKNTGDQGNGKRQSRPPANTQALSLAIEIQTTIRRERHERLTEAIRAINHTRIQTLKDRRPLNTPEELRQIISDITAQGDSPIQDGWTMWQWWHSQLTQWAAQIRATLGETNTWRLYGAQCRTCHTTTVPAFNTDGTENGTQPALIVHMRDDMVHNITCDMCGTQLANGHLRNLWDDMVTLSP